MARSSPASRTFLLLAAVALLAGCTTPSSPPAAPPVDAPAQGADLVILNTSAGLLFLRIESATMPLTAGNFLNLTEQGFYDGQRFHRVVGPDRFPPNGLVIQAGDPRSRNVTDRAMWGFGLPNQTKIPDEYPRDAAGNLVLRHDGPGIVAMANRGNNTADSQFYITLNQTSWLDGTNAVFGRVVGGMDVVRAIARVPTDEQQRPVADVLIHSAFVACRQCL